MKPQLQRLISASLLTIALGLTGCASTKKQPDSSDTSASEGGGMLEEEVVLSSKRDRRAERQRQRAEQKKRQAAEQARREAPASIPVPMTVSSPRSNSEKPLIDITLREPQATDYAAQGYQIFKDYGVNPTIVTQSKPDSTFAMDVDTGAYQLALATLNAGRLPASAGIRAEEFINAMHYQYQNDGNTFTFSAEAAPSHFRQDYHLLHVGIQSQSLEDQQRPPANLVLVADVSGSMANGGKLPLLKEAFKTLVGQLGKHDNITIVSYSNQAKVLLKATSAKHKRKIYEVINKLRTEGSTNAQAGLNLAYRLAERHFEPGFINRVIISSDGLANVGASTPKALLAQVQQYKDKNIFLTTVGVGVGMYNDFLMEQLADQGNGNYLYLADSDSIRRSFVDGLNQQLVTVAKNAKIQMEFDPAAVSHYRLIGYENRRLNREDFLDTDKDGGEVGAGHRVTALYEIKLTEHAKNTPEAPLGQLRVAYQKPEGDKLFTLQKDLPSSIVKGSLAKASSDLRLSMAVAAFAEKLRLSYWSDTYSYDDIMFTLRDLPSSYLKSDQIKDLNNAIRQASFLDRRDSPYKVSASHERYSLDHVPLLK